MGFSKAETVKIISEKFGCSRQGIYYHFSNRDKWQSDFINYKDSKELFNLVINRLNYVYREASFNLLHADNSNAKAGCLRLMMDSTVQLAVFGGLKQDKTVLSEIEPLGHKIIQHHLYSWRPGDPVATSTEETC